MNILRVCDSRHVTQTREEPGHLLPGHNDGASGPGAKLPRGCPVPQPALPAGRGTLSWRRRGRGAGVGPAGATDGRSFNKDAGGKGAARPRAGGAPAARQQREARGAGGRGPASPGGARLRLPEPSPGGVARRLPGAHGGGTGCPSPRRTPTLHTPDYGRAPGFEQLRRGPGTAAAHRPGPGPRVQLGTQ